MRLGTGKKSTGRGEEHLSPKEALKSMVVVFLVQDTKGH